MCSAFLPATPDIREAIEQETTTARGSVLDCFDDGHRLVLRAVLPMVQQVRKKDRVQAGIAVMTTDETIVVAPYTFREVCRNGAIRAEAPDLVGTGSGQQMGGSVMLRYRIRLPEDAGGHVLSVTDWMYLAPNGTIINRSQFRKFGIKVAELVATMRPAQA